jgi:outer membrane lipoprotein-sorting protein
MSVFTARPALRWLVPAAVTAAVIGGGAAARTLTATAEPSLPPRTAAQLLVDLQTARLDGGSGTVVQRADLGLPALPSAGGQGSSDLSSLVSGSHTLRVWYSGPDKARVALLGTLGQSDVIRVGREVWTWNSRENAATHRVLPAEDGGQRRPPLDPSAVPATPQEAADAALRAIEPTTLVTTGRSGRVAGRAAYELELRPRDAGSLVGQVRLAVDAEKHVPLRVQLYPKGSDAAAFEVAFTQISFARPDDAQFRFAPPPGTKVTEVPAEPARPQQPAKPDAAAQRPPYVVLGAGWTSVLVTRAPQADPAAAAPRERDGREGREGRAGGGDPLAAMPRASGAWGSGRIISGKLFSVLITDDGRLLAGAVDAQRLYQAAADPAAALK